MVTVYLIYKMWLSKLSFLISEDGEEGRNKPSNSFHSVAELRLHKVIFKYSAGIFLSSMSLLYHKLELLNFSQKHT